MNLENISIIVVEPQTPGNIGSIARACKNLGISSIILVNPCDYLVGETYRFGKNAKDLVHKMKVVNRLEDCLHDHHILISTTQRRRDKQTPFYTPPELISFISADTIQNKVGIVFGRENNGLTNTELDLCNFQSSIPAHASNPVFNLSQAVLIYAYECFNASNEDKDVYTRELSTKTDEHILFKKMDEMLSLMPIDMNKGVDNFSLLLRRVLSRATLEKRDIRLFHSFFGFIKKSIVSRNS
jgi:TrmH family RNA methyltransferase